MVEPCSKVNAEVPQRGSEAAGFQRETPRYLREGIASGVLQWEILSYLREGAVPGRH